MWRSVLKGVDRAVCQVRDELYGVLWKEAAPDNPSRKRKQLAREKVEEIEMEATSPRGFVVAARDGFQDTSVVLQKGALARLGVTKLAAEVNAAISKATRMHAQAGRKLRQEVFETDRFAATVGKG